MSIAYRLLLAMYFKNRKLAYILSLAMLSTTAVATEPAENDKSRVSFNATPSRCIALHQGQTCYTKVTLTWQDIDEELCLFEASRSEALTCGASSDIKRYVLIFESDVSLLYELRSRSNNELLGQTVVKISWVYKENTEKTSRWRLF